MNGYFAEAVYQSLLGNMIIPLSGVENAFADGKLCEKTTLMP